MVATMAKRFNNPTRKQKNLMCLVYCEGETEYWYLNKVLNSREVKLIPANNSDSNVLKMVNAACKEFNKPERYKALYCVFDHDASSNTKEQLQSANQIILQHKHIRVFSNLSFEVVFCFANKFNTSIYQNVKAIEDVISKENKIDYKKQQIIVETLANKLSFNAICDNSKKCYEQLNINNDNWLDIQDGYSEIFKLKDLVA